MRQLDDTLEIFFRLRVLLPIPGNQYQFSTCVRGRTIPTDYAIAKKFSRRISRLTSTLKRLKDICILPQSHAPSKSPFSEDSWKNTIVRKPNSKIFSSRYPKSRGTGEMFYYRAKGHVPKYDSSGNFMVSCRLCHADAYVMLHAFLPYDLLKPVCRACDNNDIKAAIMEWEWWKSIAWLLLIDRSQNLRRRERNHNGLINGLEIKLRLSFSKEWMG